MFVAQPCFCGIIPGVKYWEIIADKLSKAGWSWGCVSAVDREGRTIFVADAHRDDGRRLRIQISGRTVWIDQTFLQKG